MCSHTSYPTGSCHSPNLFWVPANGSSSLVQPQKPSSDLPFTGSSYTQSICPIVSQKKPKVILPKGS